MFGANSIKMSLDLWKLATDSLGIVMLPKTRSFGVEFMDPKMDISNDKSIFGQDHATVPSLLVLGI